jgi:hypothetical protein
MAGVSTGITSTVAGPADKSVHSGVAIDDAHPQGPDTMATFKPTLTEHARYTAFVADLTRLSPEYGIAISAFGGVHIAEDQHDLKGLTYVADASSGDLYPNED